MITGKDYMDAIMEVKKAWGDPVLMALCVTEKTPMTFNEFLDHCVCCGGNWGAMFLSGIKALYPVVYDAIPDDMGPSGNEAFLALCHLRIVLGVDTSGD